MTASSATNPVETLGDLERLLALMKSFGVAIVELPGGLKVVMHPEQPAPALVQRGDAEPDLPPLRPPTIHDDPFLYPDGQVPRFGS